jgi:tRNA-specific 2-thiouridylase
VKFARLAERAADLGFDAVATGHHARIGERDGRCTLARGADRAKDQSYVVHMLDQAALATTLFPVGVVPEKAQLRALAADLGLRTATKPDSQDVCFITSTGGRRDFLQRRIPFHPATVIDTTGARVGEVAAVELVTIGQRRGLGLPGGGPKRFVVDVDRAKSTVVVGDAMDVMRPGLDVRAMSWVDEPVDGDVLVQSSAHGVAHPAHVECDDGGVSVRWHEPQRRVAPGQSVVLYDPTDTYVLGGGLAV